MIGYFRVNMGVAVSPHKEVIGLCQTNLVNNDVLFVNLSFCNDMSAMYSKMIRRKVITNLSHDHHFIMN